MKIDKPLIENVTPELRIRLKKELAGCRDAAAVCEILSKNGIRADMAQCEAVLKLFAGSRELDMEDLDAVAGAGGGYPLPGYSGRARLAHLKMNAASPTGQSP